MADTASKKTIIGIFDIINLQKYYVEMDGLRYRRDGVLVNYEQND